MSTFDRSAPRYLPDDETVEAHGAEVIIVEVLAGLSPASLTSHALGDWL
jgi:hypothetical protein